jgi:hypothetical protein
MKKFKSIFIALSMLIPALLSAEKPSMLSRNLDTIMGNLKPAVNSVNKATSTVYGDTKELIKYGGNVLEKTAVRADTLLMGALRIGKDVSIHTFNVVKTQQLVKSLHHLFYWLLGILMLFLLLKNLKDALSTQSSVTSILALFYGVMFTTLTFYNSSHFMEMWTGFFNPEYGAYLDILQYYKNGVSG